MLHEHDVASAETAPSTPALNNDYLESILGPTDNPEMLGRIGSYEESGVIGHGGTGIVLKAFDGKLNRFVAIKALAPSFACNASARARFEREGKAVAAVSHDLVDGHVRALPQSVSQDTLRSLITVDDGQMPLKWPHME